MKAPTITDDELIAKHDPKVKARARVEAAICRRLLKDFTEKGYALWLEGERVTDGDDALKTMFNLDEVRLGVTRLHDHYQSFVFLVFGNDGYDLISDYGISLETVVEPIMNWIEVAQDAGLCPVP